MTSPKTKRRRKKHNKESKSEENNDRISDLPDCVRLHILSFLNTKDAVQTCILSTRWNHLWKRLPTLKLTASHFSTLRGSTKFVSRFLSLRNGSTAIHDLDFHHTDLVESRLLKRMVNYTVSHNVQRLRISVKCDIEQIPPCIFSCRTLTSLSLSVFNTRHYGGISLFPNSLNLPALTSLYLKFFAFRGGDDGRTEPFSALKRLNSLFIDNCRVLVAQNLCISSTTLVNLTIRTDLGYGSWYSCSKLELHAPSLCSFAFTGIPLQKLCSGSNLSSIKQVDIDATMWPKYAKPPLILLSWMIKLADLKSLTVSANTLQVLSLVPDLLKVKFSSLCNLKSLKVKMKPVPYRLSMMILRDVKLEQAATKSWKEAAKLREAIKAGLGPSFSICDRIVDFLLQNSPSAEVEIIEDCFELASRH